MDREGDTIVLLSYPGLVDPDVLVLDISLALTRYFTGTIIILLKSEINYIGSHLP